MFGPLCAFRFISLCILNNEYVAYNFLNGVNYKIFLNIFLVFLNIGIIFGWKENAGGHAVF